MLPVALAFDHPGVAWKADAQLAADIIDTVATCRADGAPRFRRRELVGVEVPMACSEMNKNGRLGGERALNDRL